MPVEEVYRLEGVMAGASLAMVVIGESSAGAVSVSVSVSVALRIGSQGMRGDTKGIVVRSSCSIGFGRGGGGGRMVQITNAPLLLVGILVASQSLGLEELLVAEEAREEPGVPPVKAGGGVGW